MGRRLVYSRDAHLQKVIIAKVDKVLVLALAGLILAVMTIGTAYADTVQYSVAVWSRLYDTGSGADQIHAEWYLSASETNSLSHLAPKSDITTPNYFTNAAPNITSTRIFWYRCIYGDQGTMLDPTMDGNYVGDTILNYGQTTPNMIEHASIFAQQPAGSYSYDEAHVYYPTQYPYYYYAYNPSPMARKTLTVT